MLAWPTVPAPAPPLEAPIVELPSGTETADQANVRGGALANLTGTPAISVPVGLSSDGLPIGLQLGAAWGRDELLLDAAEALERANGRRWVEARPALAVASGLDAGSRRRDRRAGPAAELARGRARRDALRLHPAEPRPLPLAVVLGLLLRGDRLAPLRPRPRARAELREPARGAARRTASSATRSSGTARSRSAACPSTTSPRAAPSRPRRSSRRCWPGPGGSRSATRPRSRGSPPRSSGWRANRDLEGDGLLWIVQPDESGLDASPKFEPVWGRRANGRIGFPLLVHRNRRLGFDAAADPRAPAGRCSARSSSTPSGRSRCRRSGGPRRRRRWSSGSGTRGAGLFVDEAQPGGGRPRAVTWASLAPLALPDLPEEIGRRLVEEHLLERARVPRRRSRRPRSPPSEPSYEPGGGHGPIRRYWRGPTWVNSAWMVWLGLRRLGYEQEARAAGRRA